MARRRNTEEDSLERILELLDEKVKARGAAVLAVEDTSAEIARLASEARRHGVTMPELTKHVQTMDKRTRKLRTVSRQQVDNMLAAHEQRRDPRTTRASRRRRESTPAGSLNTAAFE